MLRICIVICCICFLGCSNVTTETGLEIVNKSIEAHGGQKTFQELDSISFTKTTRLFKEDGSLESEASMKQSFKLAPMYSVTIHWMESNDEHQVFYDQNELVKLVNNVRIYDQYSIDRAMKLALAAEYVFFQPFRLINSKGRLSYEGKLRLQDSIETSVVAIVYEGDSSSSDAWRYYFDENSRLVAASVKHNNRNSLIENLDFQWYKGILFNKVRKSYFVDSTFQKKQLRAEYYYEIVDAGQ